MDPKIERTVLVRSRADEEKHFLLRQTNEEDKTNLEKFTNSQKSKLFDAGSVGLMVFPGAEIALQQSVDRKITI